MRLFFAVDLPDDLAESFAAIQEEFEEADGLSFTDPEQAHVTLKFLGETDLDLLEDLASSSTDELVMAGVGPFDCHVGGLGVFPSMEYISVVWVGVDDGAAELTRLHEGLESATTELGVDPEEHEFTPHITLARMNDARGKDLVQDRVRSLDPDVGRFTVEEVHLKKSELSSDGPRYETIGRIPLEDPYAFSIDL